MGFAIGGLKESHLAGGALRDILGGIVVEPKPWAKHVAKLPKRGAGAATCRAVAAALGHAVPAELAEWIDAEGPKGMPEPIDAGWYVGLDLAAPASAKQAIGEHALMMFVGAVPFGRDGSGDQVFVSVRP